jgi:DNA-binding NarL/FixJ family response regulator
MPRSHPTVAPPARIILGDDHLLLLEALRKLLEPEFNVVRVATDGEELVAATAELRPDAVVCDLSMPGLSGLAAGRRILEEQPGIRLVCLTMHRDPALAAEALALGASAYVLKSSAGAGLRTALRVALVGGTYLDPLLGSERPPVLQRAADAEREERVSPREREVLRLLAKGFTMKQVAGRLGIATRTVAFHKYHLMRVLSARSSAELVQYAVKRRLV